MSRIGNIPVAVPGSVKIEMKGKKIKVTGPKGALEHVVNDGITVTEDKGRLVFKRSGDSRKLRALHGLTRALLNNMIVGVTRGFERELQVIGTGYTAEILGPWLKLSVGYSHDILLQIPEGIAVEAEAVPRREQGALGVQAVIKVSGIDKEDVGKFAAEIRRCRPPAPNLKGKGIRWKDEHVRIVSKAGAA
ncbi:MAG: 50S ribosomal protein L6 [Candidatus Cloacimonetes bacterium]|nr:50S ribosomal protein L6 [Candidatus Cloacimonadota bacterium]